MSADDNWKPPLVAAQRVADVAAAAVACVV